MDLPDLNVLGREGQLLPDRVQRNFESLNQLSRTVHGGTVSPPILTSLPSSPYNGQIIHLKYGVLVGVFWYDSSVGDAYKWRAISAPPLTAGHSDGGGSHTSHATAYSMKQFVSPAVTLPFAGYYRMDYKVQWKWAAVQSYTYSGGGTTAAYAANADGDPATHVTRAGFGSGVGAFTASTSVGVIWGCSGSSQSVQVWEKVVAATPERIG